MVTAQNITSEYHDPLTNFTFHGWASDSGYRFGLIVPPSDQATDFIAQLVGPLNTDGGGWAGVAFGRSMMGPLLLAAWPTGDPSHPVIVSPRVAHGKSADLVHVYDNHPVQVKLIPQGTTVNSTHFTATILCQGCVNSDSFEMTASSEQFGYAHSLKKVETPGSQGTRLSSHSPPDGSRGSFGIDITQAKSEEFASYAQAAVAVVDSTAAPTTAGGSRPTGTAVGVAPTGTKPSGAEGRRSGMVGLVLAGLIAAVRVMI
ncbi:hypothetical protein B0T14DRAFT_435510 [Immersiella caudata]|uniref:Cellobiose dehydrogenase-like cytochrome domain-containing protein n=1 Tax=Immersiella caudata TaxID=314043 RepID=A0AA39WJ15_9PEZI|nr:hypothetical protein B0T14DRAFT_435510 [Immersiella caudata]